MVDFLLIFWFNF